MRNLKKFLALVLAMMMTLSLMVTVNASSFKDDGDITGAYTEAVDVLTELKVIKGYSDGSFLPKEKITRAEVAAIIYRLTTGDVSDSNIHLYDGYSEFSDVAGDKWYTPYVNYCANNGLVNGVGNNRFAPSANVTGYEALVMILRAIGYNNPAEFSSSDWKFKASGYGSRLGITTNIPAGSLGAEATREMVAEIMFQGILAPTVTYSPLTMYTNNVLVAAGTKGADYTAGGGADLTGTVVYSNDVYSTLMYEVFKIVGKMDYLVTDGTYGRPAYRWVKDAATDELGNGTKYVVNTNRGTYNYTWHSDPANNSTPGITAFNIPLTPVKTYYEAITECQLATDVNGNKTILKENLDEYLNGRLVADRTEDLDALHTSKLTTENVIGAQGRATEVYKTGVDAEGNPTFVLVYIDTLLGTVTGIVPRTYDTAGHVMVPAKLSIAVNDTVTVDYTDDESDFPEWKAGDLILIHTWGANDNGEHRHSVGYTLDVTSIPTSVPYHEDDFKTANADGTANAVWAVEIEETRPTTTEMTVTYTSGEYNLRDGLADASGVSKANVVYLKGLEAAPNATDMRGNTLATAKTSPKFIKIQNECIGQSYKLIKDLHGNIVGMTAAGVGKIVGVIDATEGVRVGVGKWALEAELVLMDGTRMTGVRMLKNGDTNYNASTTYTYWDDITAVDSRDISEILMGATKNVLVEIEPYTKDGATYYKVTAVDSTIADKDDLPDGTAAANNDVITGVTDTLKDDNTKMLTDSTKFLISAADYYYNQDGNTGALGTLSYRPYTGFKTIPTITTSEAGNLVYQKIGGNVYIYPKDPAKDFQLKQQTKVVTKDTYLVLAPIATYADYSTYRVLHNGVESTLAVSNWNNMAGAADGLNKTVEAAMDAGQIIEVTGRNFNGHVTSVNVFSVALGGTESGINKFTQTVAASVAVTAAGGVFTFDDGNHVLTIDDNCVVKIVNLVTGQYFDANLATVKQYEEYDANGDGDWTDATDSHDFVYETNEYGYISAIYIID